jgi:glyceraldehyde 3-phosphate dehydrogenase
MISSIHATTAKQRTVDGPSNLDWRGGRATNGNVILSSASATEIVGKVIPSLDGKLRSVRLFSRNTCPPLFLKLKITFSFVCVCVCVCVSSISGVTLRVPTNDVSLLDFVVRLEKEATYDQIKQELKAASQGHLKGIIDYTDDMVVSTDLIGNTASCIFDANGGVQLGKNFVKLIAWYDNEWGYSKRLVDLLVFVAEKDGGGGQS